jgi:hypothetical protein
MKYTITLLMICLITLPALSQGKKYQKAMQKSLEQMAEAADRDSYLACAASFQNIAEEYPDQWLPLYYASQVLINLSFEDLDTERGDSQLDQAKALIKKALDIDPDVSELHVLRALMHLARITLAPDIRGPVYFEMVDSALNKAKQLDPENPRAYFLDGLITLNLPEFIGGGPVAAKPIFLEAAEKYRAFENDDPLWPDWGEEDNRSQLEAMGEIQ